MSKKPKTITITDQDIIDRYERAMQAYCEDSQVSSMTHNQVIEKLLNDHDRVRAKNQPRDEKGHFVPKEGK